MLNTKLVLIALALAAGLVASDTTSITPDSVIPETDNAPLSSKVKAGPMMKKTSQVPSSAGYLAPPENEFVEEASGSPRQVTTELIDTTFTTDTEMPGQALWGQPETTCVRAWRKCYPHQSCCGTLKWHLGKLVTQQMTCMYWSRGLRPHGMCVHPVPSSSTTAPAHGYV